MHLEPLRFHLPIPPPPAPVAAAATAAADDPFGVHAAPAPVTFGGRQYTHLPVDLAQCLAAPAILAPQ